MCFIPEGAKRYLKSLRDDDKRKRTGKYKKHRVQMRRLDRQREVITFYSIIVLNLIASESLVTVKYDRRFQKYSFCCFNN